MNRIAIDTGGTFTDCVFLRDGELNILKIASTPDDPAQAVLEAVASLDGADEIRLGTTVGTNALLERRGARVAFVTTQGFEDTIAIGRQARSRLHELFVSKDPPLVEPELRFGVAERIACDGSMVLALTKNELHALTERVRSARPEAIAISLLFSFANPAHERAVAEALRPLGVPLSVSHRLLPEFREYERGSTTVINAYLAPKVGGYLQRIDEQLRNRGARLQVMQSSGGIVPAAVAAHEPVRTVLSGPAGGVVGAAHVARSAGFSKVLSFDMGGTSTDVALIETDRPFTTTNEFQIHGMPVAVPMLDIHTVGAGGGSRAGFDAGGALQVGPASAGAVPGPICYGRGEGGADERPTVTDANLLLGRIDAQHFLGGRMRLLEERARAVFDRERGPLASVEQFAEGIVQVADMHMLAALRRISVERGRDPRENALVSFGGAGPLHACALARSLRIARVLIPRSPGALSAYGILVSDVVRDYSQTIMCAPGSPAIERSLHELQMIAARDMSSYGLRGTSIPSLDIRYVGQAYELTVPLSDGFISAFHRMHAEHYGYQDRERPVEVVNARLRVVSETHAIPEKRQAVRPGTGQPAELGEKRIFSGGRWHSGKLYERAQLRPGDRFDGPAVIVEYSATTFLAPDAQAEVDAFENLVITL